LQIDSNGDGELTLEEFCQGICGIVSSNAPQELRDMHALLKTDFTRIFDILDRLESRLEKGLERVCVVEKLVSKSSLGSEANFPLPKEEKMGIPSMQMQRAYKPPKSNLDPKLDPKEREEMLPVRAPAWVFKLLGELEQSTSIVAKLPAVARIDTPQGTASDKGTASDRGSFASSTLLSPRPRHNSKLNPRNSAVSAAPLTEEAPSVSWSFDLSSTVEQAIAPSDKWRETSSEMYAGGKKKKKLIRNRTCPEAKSPRCSPRDQPNRTKSSVFDVPAQDMAPTRSSLFDLAKQDITPSNLGQSDSARDCCSPDGTGSQSLEKMPILKNKS